MDEHKKKMFFVHQVINECYLSEGLELLADGQIDLDEYGKTIDLELLREAEQYVLKNFELDIKIAIKKEINKINDFIYCQSFSELIGTDLINLTT